MRFEENTLVASRTEDERLALILSSFERIQEAALKCGVRLSTHSEASIEAFRAWQPARQELILGQLQSLAGLFSLEKEIIDNSLDLEHLSLQKAIWSYGFFSKVDIKDYINDGDIVEIYDSNHVQIFRNFQFFKFSSYTLLDIMTQEWFTLYERPEHVTATLIKNIEKMYEVCGPVKVEVAPHIMKERYLDARRALLLQSRWLIPLFSQDSTAPIALVHVVKAELLDDATNVAVLGPKSTAIH